MPPLGFTMPFQVSSGSVGYFLTTESELDAVKQNLNALLHTNWGERAMHYKMGCNFREFLFEQQRGSILRKKVADRILDQVGTWMPFVVVDTLNVVLEDEDPTVPENAIRVRIGFRLVARPDRGAIIETTVSP